MDETTKALRAVLDGLPRIVDETTAKARYVPIEDARRPAGLPPVEDILDALPRGIEPWILSKAVHEAGHATVAIACGMTVTAVTVDRELDPGGMGLREFSCDISGPADYDEASVASAGILSEALVWGHDVYWFGAAYDFLDLWRAVNRRDPLSRAAAAMLRTARLPVPSAFAPPRPTVASFVEGRDAIPERALAHAIEAFPATLRVAALLAERFQAGEKSVPGDEVAEAASGPAALGMQA